MCLLDAQFTGANLPINEAGVASSSRGLVGDTIFAVLPNIKPVHTFVITIAIQSVSSLCHLFRACWWPVPRSGWSNFGVVRNISHFWQRWRCLAGRHSYLVGMYMKRLCCLSWYHLGMCSSFSLHWTCIDKGSNSLLAAESQAHFRTFVLASVAGVFSLFPLIFTPSGVCWILFPLVKFSQLFFVYIESVIKVIYSIIWIAAVYIPLNRRVYEYASRLLPLMSHWRGISQQIPQIHSLCNRGFVRESVPNWVPVSAALCFYISILANTVRDS